MKLRTAIGMGMAFTLSGCGAIVELNTGDDAGAGGGSSEASTTGTIGQGDALVANVDANGGGGGPGGGTAPDAAQACTKGNQSLGANLNPIVQRYEPNGTTVYPSRPANEAPLGIDATDCSQNIILNFIAFICGLPTTDTFEAWVGTTDCTQATAREAGDGPRCWRVTPPGEIGNSATTSFNIRAQDIVGYLGNSNPPTTYTAASGSVCSTLESLGTTCGPTLSLYVMAIEPDGITVDTSAAAYEIGLFDTAQDGIACAGFSGQ